MKSTPERLKGLLDYLEAIERLKEKPVMVVPARPLALTSSDLPRYAELETNLLVGPDEVPVWLKLPRLKPILPPPLLDSLLPWVDLSSSPKTEPALRPEAQGVDAVGKSRVLRLADHPDIRGLFEEYRKHLWQPWADTESVRRNTIDLYQRLFGLLQELREASSDSQQELVWGIGHAAWCPTPSIQISYPLLTVPCDLTLDTRNSAILVSPRNKGVRLELAPFMSQGLASQCRALEAYWAAQQDSAELNPFDRASIAPLLQFAAANLSRNGAMRHMPPLEPVPRPTSDLVVTDQWTLFARPRPTDILLRDIDNLRKAVDHAPSIPSVVESLVTEAASETGQQAHVIFRGLATNEAADSASNRGSVLRELYFPMPYNDEQLTIARKLEVHDGVVVQGPPGTGKTYTIANIICHYLAQGKRVLVTSKGESALRVLQEKLPEKIRPLSVALMSEDGDGYKQFSRSIESIAEGLSFGTDADLQASIRISQETIDHCHGRIARIDQVVAQLAAEHLRTHTVDGETLVAGDLAKLVLEGHPRHEWFDDGLPESGPPDPGLTDAEVHEIRAARLRLGLQLKLIDEQVPQVADLPTAAEVMEWHRNLQRAAEIEQQIQTGAVFPLVGPAADLAPAIQSVKQFLDERQVLIGRLEALQAPWLSTFLKQLLRLPDTDPVLGSLFSICSNALSLEAERRELLTLAVTAPPGIEGNPEAMAAIQRAAVGERLFPALLPFGYSAARTAIASIEVSGQKPIERSHWQAVLQLLNWRNTVRALPPRYTPLAMEIGLPEIPAGIEESLRALLRIAETVGLAKSLARDYEAPLTTRLAEIFPSEVVHAVAKSGQLVQAASSLQSHLSRIQLVQTMAEVRAVQARLDSLSGQFVGRLRRFLAESLGDLKVSDAMIRTGWSGLARECQTILDLQPDLTTVRSRCAQIASLGAVRWAERLRREAAQGQDDPLIPNNWREAWRWQHYRLLLERIDGHQALQERFRKREEASKALARAYQELVASKTWLALRQGTPDKVKQALASYQSAVMSMPKSVTAKSRPRYLRQAREAMERAYPAVPCWIMPHWRISEAIPATLGLFDLVVIDEASQSDSEALPAILRGKKVLVVGDDKQVSPSSIGITEEMVGTLYDRYLRDQPHGDSLMLKKSIYDLAKTVFAGQAVMLKEHFRCVPAIIEYSKREFYSNQLIPLRLPLNHERLDPPLIDVFVKGGHRTKDINRPEALAIVDEIERIIQSPLFVGRTIGVVTLHGNDQASLIQELITKRITPSEILKRQLSVGAPPAFQGRERDIMMISMVNDGRAAGPNSSLGQQQRFNVALSRARDRMYLFRSFQPEQIDANTLTGRVLAHFRQPFQNDARQDRSMRARCESDFERDVFDALVSRGFRVCTQVSAGIYRIDLVVEDESGRRLAVECDGDRYHGPDRWSYDMARQRVLERAGWRFWRCFASSFYRRTDEVLADLLATLADLNITPIGQLDFDRSDWTSFIEADPLGLDEPEANEESDLSASDTAEQGETEASVADGGSMS